MEESEKRRERLKAMRMEASKNEVSDGQVAAGGPGILSNPLLVSTATPSVLENKFAVSRFDFYTDPMSAFSNSKKRNGNGQIRPGYFSPPMSNGSPMGQISPSHSAGPRNFDMSPTHQFPMNYSPDQRLYETSLPAPVSYSWRTPPGVPSSFSGHRGAPVGVSVARNHSGGSSGFGRGRFQNPDYGRGGSSPRPNMGRGSYHRNNSMTSPGSGGSKGRGRGFHACVSAQEQPDLFYTESMIKDPWESLKPVVRSSSKTAKDVMKTPNSWLPKSLSTKKAKISEVIPRFSSQSSLADSLSVAFEEAVQDV